MEYMSNILETSLNRYFNSLALTGYMNDKSVNLLLLLNFLIGLLLEFIITEEDYVQISKIVTCLQLSSCMVPYKSYIQALEESSTYLHSKPVKITLDDIIRISLDLDIRLVN